MSYKPSRELLKKYSDVIVKFALWSGDGIKPGEMVFIQLPESARAMYLPLQQSVLEAGGHPVIELIAEGVMKEFYESANEEQITYFPKKTFVGKIEDCTHRIRIMSEGDVHELTGVDSQKIMQRLKAGRFFMDEMFKKEGEGNLTWCIALFGTESMAKEAGMSLEEYWEQIIVACFLDKDDPINEWKKVYEVIYGTLDKLNVLEIEYVHVKGEDVDLNIKIGSDRKWLGGSGRNIPSFECFVSPDWRETSGWIQFNQPLYRYGALIKDIRLEFKDGLITKATASHNEKALLDMIAVEGANKIGEFSLTDSRTSRITKFMAQTLFDENIGGEYGNTHIAIGSAYKDSFKGDVAGSSSQDWIDRGYNESAVHTDIVSTTNRVVTATLKDGTKKIIYADGKFVLD